MSELLKFIVKNKEVITFFVTCFTVLMLIWSNYESKKSRELQYMPYLRLILKPNILEFFNPYKDDEIKEINSKDIISQYFSENNKSTKNIFKIINDGVGFAKDIKLIIDYTKIIDILEKHQNYNDDFYYLKSLLNLYEVKSFQYPIYERFNLRIRFCTKIYNKILNLKSVIINKIKKQSTYHVRIGKPILFRKHNVDIIRQNNDFKIDTGEILNLISLIYLINTDDYNKKFKLPILLEYSTIDNKRRRQYYELNIIFYFARNMMKMTDNQLNEIINGEISKEEVCKKLYHNINISYNFIVYNNLKKYFKILKYNVINRI